MQENSIWYGHAFAKINLFLDVIGKMPDGYHEVSTVMQQLELCDDLRIEVIEENFNHQIKYSSVQQVTLETNIENLATDDTNLVIRAAKALIAEYGITARLKIFLHKRIPMGAGLAGGSSDAAATLNGINTLFSLNIPQQKLMQTAATLGADVPFCLMGGTALAAGIGEKLTPLITQCLSYQISSDQCYVILICPKIHVSTVEIFNRLDPQDFGKLDLQQFLYAYHSGDITKISKQLSNIFTQITASIHPEIFEYIELLKNYGALNAQMTGTGSTVFSYFENEAIANNAYEKLKKIKMNVNIFFTKVRKI